MGDFSVYVNSFNTNSNFSKFVLIYMLLFFIVFLVNFIGMIKIYKKLNKPGWAVIVPIYNMWALFEGVGLPGWLSILPVANFIGLIVAYFRLAKVLNKSTGFGLGLVFLSFIFIPILGFSDAKMSSSEENSVEGFDLMASDPNAGGELNLMTPDPVSSVPTEAQSMAQPEAPTIDTTPTFEEQISESAPSVSPAFVPSEPVQEPVQPEVVPNLGAEQTPTLVDDNIFAESTVDVKPVNSTPVSSEPEVINIFDEGNSAEVKPELPEKNPEEIFNSPSFENTIPIEKISNPEIPSADMELPKLASDDVAAEIMGGTKICPNCGHENGASIKACLKCGHLID